MEIKIEELVDAKIRGKNVIWQGIKFINSLKKWSFSIAVPESAKALVDFIYLPGQTAVEISLLRERIEEVEMEVCINIHKQFKDDDRLHKT